ncbi:hypothetical protein Z517_03861 [Fonsecaea pedrosoi CBS 271.37]|uniref:Uncharacterized protein n=1 Tax=Fonsecaea pedrosoi CBS 271.37 TaxID=1442368 RepID=A0A0D2E3I5_9EURO|nr:uncharacterized protein Z517_03861 [Fonsecaea pedrosoi CBS 271.37]KIW84611.1 hypothetical protein Z517_03861 [Fonsecaea pedrosoi CBS 271.37]
MDLHAPHTAAALADTPHRRHYAHDRLFTAATAGERNPIITLPDRPPPSTPSRTRPGLTSTVNYSVGLDTLVKRGVTRDWRVEDVEYVPRLNRFRSARTEEWIDEVSTWVEHLNSGIIVDPESGLLYRPDDDTWWDKTT